MEKPAKAEASRVQRIRDRCAAVVLSLATLSITACVGPVPKELSQERLELGQGTTPLGFESQPYTLYASESLQNTITALRLELSPDAKSILKLQKVGISTIGDDVRDVIISPDGRFAHAVDFSTLSIKTFSINPTEGRLEAVGSETGLPYLHASRLAMNAGGDVLMVLNPVYDKTLVFKRDPGTGKLTYLSLMRNSLYGASAFKIHPSGSSIYVMGNSERTKQFHVVAYRVDPLTGEHDFMGYHPVEFGKGFPWEMAFSHSGNDLFVSKRGSTEILRLRVYSDPSSSRVTRVPLDPRPFAEGSDTLEERVYSNYVTSVGPEGEVNGIRISPSGEVFQFLDPKLARINPKNCQDRAVSPNSPPGPCHILVDLWGGFLFVSYGDELRLYIINLEAGTLEEAEGVSPFPVKASRVGF